MKKYEYFDVTADIGFKAYGNTLDEAFENAGLAIFNIISDTSNISSYVGKVFEITSDIKELGNACVLGAGGRYNDLVKNLDGPETPCVGFAAGIDRIITTMDVLEVEPFQKDVEVYIMYVNASRAIFVYVASASLIVTSYFSFVLFLVRVRFRTSPSKMYFLLFPYFIRF